MGIIGRTTRVTRMTFTCCPNVSTRRSPDCIWVPLVLNSQNCRKSKLITLECQLMAPTSQTLTVTKQPERILVACFIGKSCTGEVCRRSRESYCHDDVESSFDVRLFCISVQWNGCSWSYRGHVFEVHAAEGCARRTPNVQIFTS